jgi:hypothetical protein
MPELIFTAAQAAVECRGPGGHDHHRLDFEKSNPGRHLALRPLGPCRWLAKRLPKEDAMEHFAGLCQATLSNR